MALSGTLETFSLPEVLRLLSSTKKTGVLALEGDRGHGAVWVRDGAIVAAEADRARFAEVDGVLFELLRFLDAAFEFRPGEEPLDPCVEPRDVHEGLAAAEARLTEWRAIEAVVPSLDVMVRMVADIDDVVTVTPDQWRVLAHVGSGISGHDLSARLEEGEYDVCRQLLGLVDAGLAEVDDARAATEPVPAGWTADGPVVAAPWTMPAAPAPFDELVPVEEARTQPVFVGPALSSDQVSSLGADLASFVASGAPSEPTARPADADAIRDTAVTDTAVTDTAVDDATPDDATPEEAGALAVDEYPWAFEAMVDVDEIGATDADDDRQVPADVEEPLAPSGADLLADEVAQDPDDGQDFLAQLVHLSPKAAAAIEATAGAAAVDADPAVESECDTLGTTVGPVDTGAGDRPDQNLLLRFLSATDR